MLDVPVNKTSTAFTKPVDPTVGETITAWEKVRPQGVKLPDPKTGEMVDFLFLYRLTVVGKTYFNDVLIPALCRKAGVPKADARGNITSHRGRSTIASQLFNAKEPMTLFEFRNGLATALRRRRNTTQRSRQPDWRSPTPMLGTSSGIFARLKCSWIRKSCGAGEGLMSRGSSTILGTATVPTTSSTSARTGWPVRSAASICQSSRHKRRCWRARQICYSFAKTFR